MDVRNAQNIRQPLLQNPPNPNGMDHPDSDDFPGAFDLTLDSLQRIISREQRTFQTQFKNRTEKKCSLVWSPDADYSQLPPTTTEVWNHWEQLVEEFVLVVRTEKTREKHQKSCCKRKHHDIHHFDTQMDDEWRGQFDALRESDPNPQQTEERNADENHQVKVKKKTVREGTMGDARLRHTEETVITDIKGDLIETTMNEKGELLLTVEHTLMFYTCRYVAYCLCLAEIHWQMLSSREAVKCCITAMHALVARQNNCFNKGEEDQEVGELLEHVWSEIRKYNRDSRMAGTGKDAFLEDLQRSFQKGDFKVQTENWLNEKYANEKANRAHSDAGSEAANSLADQLNQLDEDAAAKLQECEQKLSTAEENAKVDELEDRLVTFSRYLKNTRSQEAKYQGVGYGMSVHLMYAIVAFGLVYAYESSHCFPDGTTTEIYWSYFDGSEKTNTTFYQYDIIAIKNDRTSTIFGGVYGPSTNAGMYLFDGADSNDYYKKNYGIPVPRPSCATSCNAEFVCYQPKCKQMDENFAEQDIGIDEAAVGAICTCKPRYRACSPCEQMIDNSTYYRNCTNANFTIHGTDPNTGVANKTYDTAITCGWLPPLPNTPNYKLYKKYLDKECQGTDEGCDCTPGDDCGTWWYNGDMEVNSGTPVWDNCGVQGDFLLIFRNYWSYMYFGVAILEMVLFSMSLLFIDWPSPPRTSFSSEEFMQQRTDEIRKHGVCLLIAHYGGYGALADSLEPALAIFPPEHVFVCHNSNHLHPFDKGKAAQTLKKIRDLEKRKGYTKHINYGYSCEGNKSLAIYAVALRKCGHMKYCMMIDNDVILPEDLHIPMDIFGDKNQSHVKALAFTIKASNPFNRAGSINWVSAMQNIEYIKAGWTKMLQSQLGSALYAHGAISLWEKDIMISVFKAHNTFFDGEDLQMGVILHTFNQGYSIKCVGNVSVETEVPSHAICWEWNSSRAKEQYPIPGFHAMLRLLFVAPLKCNGWGCGYGEKSLFRQRVASWDKGAHRAFMWYVQLLLFNWSMSTIALKPYLVYEVWSIFNDWTWPWLMVLFFTSSTDDDKSTFAEWMLMITIVDLVLMSYMNQFKFSNRRDMRSRIIDCVSFALYKYVLKVLRLIALAYNLIHYFPREQTPLVISDRVALPPFIDDSCIFLDEDEANRDGIREIRQHEDTGKVIVYRATWPTGQEMHPDTPLSRTVDVLVSTSDNVTIDGPWKIHRPKHFMLKGSSWIFRRWDPSDTGEAASDEGWQMPAAPGLNTPARLPNLPKIPNAAGLPPPPGSAPEMAQPVGADHVAITGNWEKLDERQDKAGGSGLTHDIERLCVTLQWARDLLKLPLDSGGALLAASTNASTRQVSMAEAQEPRKIRAQCAFSLGGCIEGCLKSVGSLQEMRKQGLRSSGDKDADMVMASLRTAQSVMDILVRGKECSVNPMTAREDAKKDCQKLRKLSSSLTPWSLDPDSDIQAVFLVIISIGMGGLGGSQWTQLTGKNGKELAADLGLPDWIATWTWFLAVFFGMCLIFVCSLVCPMLISKYQEGKGQNIPLQKGETEKKEK